MLLLAWDSPTLAMDGVDLRPNAAELCRANLRENGLEDRCRVHTADLRAAPIEANSMDLVVTNPPYFRAGSGGVSPDADRAAMRVETASLPELGSAAARLLRPGGDLCLVHRAERLAEVFDALTASGLEPRKLRFIASRPDSAPTLFLCRARKGASPGLSVEAPLCQFGPDGAETAEYRRLCHWEDRS